MVKPWFNHELAMVFLFMVQPNLIIPSCVFLFEVWLVKILFQNRISIKSYRGKTFRGWARLLPPPPPPDQERLSLFMHI